MALNQSQNNINDAMDYIKRAVNSAGFAMKLTSLDQLDQQYYDKDSDPVFIRYIQGGSALYPIPRGAIVYTDKNAYRMACANLYFMENNDIIPIELTNIPEICNVFRSDGRVHRGRILWNEGMFFNENYDSFMLRVAFHNDEIKTVVPHCIKNNNTSLTLSKSENEEDDDDNDEKMYNRKVIYNWGTMSKGMMIKEFIEVNNMDTLVLRFQTVDIKKFSNKQKPVDNIHQDIVNKFNISFKEWIFSTLTKKLIQSNVSATIFLDDHELFAHKVK